MHSVNLLVKLLPEHRAWRKFAGLRRQTQVPGVRVLHEFRGRVGVAGRRRINAQLLAPLRADYLWPPWSVGLSDATDLPAACVGFKKKHRAILRRARRAGWTHAQNRAEPLFRRLQETHTPPVAAPLLGRGAVGAAGQLGDARQGFRGWAAGPQPALLPAAMGLVSAAVLVIDVPGRRDALRNDARPATAAGDGTALEFAAKDQLNLFGPAQSQMLANDFLEEAATAGAPVPHLGEGELGLQHRESIAIARAPVGGTEGMGQSGQPLAEEPLDLAGGEALTDLLCPLDIGTGAQAVVQGRKGDPCLGQLPLEILVPVEAELGWIAAC